MSAAYSAVMGATTISAMLTSWTSGRLVPI